jgi:hypothetical protein
MKKPSSRTGLFALLRIDRDLDPAKKSACQLERVGRLGMLF